MSKRCRGVAGWLFGHKEVVMSEGYPAYSSVWVINSRCTRCGMRFRTTDDLFAEARPYYFEIDQDFMVQKDGSQ